VKAFVVLAAGIEPSDALRSELIGFGRQRLGPAIAPREVAFADALPHTESGKVVRRALRAGSGGVGGDE
jgi:acetyl-CoA synthetase